MNLMAENTKQHFVPKMLLKRFSWDSKNVNMCNIRSDDKIKSVPYEPQCQKRYFYGTELSLEKALGKLETLIDKELNILINECIVPLMKPSAQCFDHDDLKNNFLFFIHIQYTRTLKAKKIVDSGISKWFESIKERDMEVILNKIIDDDRIKKLGAKRSDIQNLINTFNIEVNDLFKRIFSVALEYYNKNKHLKCVVIFNTSTMPFIISDNPVLNIVTFFPEHVSSFFMPISPAHYLFFYDEAYFKVRTINNVISTCDLGEIRCINKMQCENSDLNIYLPQLSCDYKIDDMVGGDIRKQGFWQMIKGISLNDKYKKSKTIHLENGHATKINHLEK